MGNNVEPSPSLVFASVIAFVILIMDYVHYKYAGIMYKHNYYIGVGIEFILYKYTVQNGWLHYIDIILAVEH